VLQLGQQVIDDGYECHASGEGVVDLVKRMPRLEELYLFAHLGVEDTRTLFGLKTLGNLRVLQVYHLEFTYPLTVLAKNPSLGRLTHLLLHPHGYSGADEGSYLLLSQVRPLLRARHLQALTHLQLHVSNVGDQGCEEIVRSRLLERLKVLDLRHGAITDEGARALAGCPDLKNLERLDLRDNALSGTGVQVLQAAGIDVLLSEQHGPQDDGYLMVGDME
jgi:hypothetical protein